MQAQTTRYAAAGILAAVAGIGVGHLTAAVVNPPASPVLAVGTAVIDATPTPVKEWATGTLGTADKPILLAIVTLVTLAAAAGIGVLSRRKPTLAFLLLLGVAALAGLAAVTRSGSGPGDVLPGVVTAVVGLLVLQYLQRLAGGTQTPGDPDPLVRNGQARRTFLIGSLATAAGAALAGLIGQSVAGAGKGPTIALPTAPDPLGPLPEGLERTVEGISSFRTPADSFYRIDTKLIVPRINAADWRLSIDGAVDHPFSIGIDELLAMPMVERDITMCCVSNEVGGPYIGGARWLGVPVRTLLERAGVRSGVDQILSADDSGFTISTPLQALTDDRDALLAVAMNGAALPEQHGYPVRMVTPGLYGFTGSMKWITTMTATSYGAASAYWTERGWATDGRVLTESRIDTPQAGASLTVGRSVAIGGVAWAQGRGVKGVEVQVDDGPWQAATLGPDGGTDYWRQWYLPWSPVEGQHRLRVRATDLVGDTQTEQVAPVYPRGATGWHEVEVRAG